MLSFFRQAQVAPFLEDVREVFGRLAVKLSIWRNLVVLLTTLCLRQTRLEDPVDTSKKVLHGTLEAEQHHGMVIWVWRRIAFK